MTHLHDDIVERMLPLRTEGARTAVIKAVCDDIDYPSGTGPVQPNDHAVTAPLRPHCDYGATSVSSDECCGTMGRPIFSKIRHGWYRVESTLYWSDGKLRLTNFPVPSIDVTLAREDFLHTDPGSRSILIVGESNLRYFNQ